MLENTPVNYVDAMSETNRYIAWPGQALCYKIGEKVIWKMRKKAEQQLDKKFDITAFHDKMLLNGALPLELFG